MKLEVGFWVELEVELEVEPEVELEVELRKCSIIIWHYLKRHVKRGTS